MTNLGFFATGQPARAAALGTTRGHRTHDRLRRGERGLTTVCLLLVLALPVVVFAGLRSQDPSDGTFTSTGGWSAAGFEVGSPSGPAGVRRRDVIVSVDGTFLGPGRFRVLPRDRATVGASVTYGVVRRGGLEQVRVTLRRYPLGRVLAAQPGAVACVVCLDAVALLVMAHRPRDPAARLMLLLGVLLPLTGWQWPAGLQAVDIFTGRFGPYLVSEVAAALVWAALLCFSLVFPRPVAAFGRRPTLQALPFVLPFVLYGFQVAGSRLPGTGRREQLAALASVSSPAAQVFPLVVIGVLMVRSRVARSDLERQQVQWLLAGLAGALALYALVGAIPSAVWGRWLVPSSWLTFAFAAVPVLMGVGILRHRLFDIQVVISRSLLYLTMTAAAAVAYTTVTLGLGRFSGHGIVPVLASGAVALVVLSVRDRWSRSVTRWLYGDRGNPYGVIDRLSHIDPAQPPRAVLSEIAETVASALRLPSVVLEVTMPAGEAERVEVGRARTTDTAVVPLTYHGEHLGRLLLTTSAGREPFGRADAQLLADLGWHVAAAVNAVRVSLTLQRSRQRLVTTREEERRRIRRDLHDGLGPTLAAAAMQLEVARGLVDRDPPGAQEVIGKVHAAAQAALTDIRRLVDDLRPATLDQLGLLSALRERANYFVGLPRPAGATDRLLSVTVEAACELGELPAAVEVAAYRIAIEAVTNTARHSDAGRCTVVLERTGTDLLVSISDDGQGLPRPASPHVGLASMRERAEELGGAFSAGPGPAGGTVVHARLPLPDQGGRA